MTKPAIAINNLRKVYKGRFEALKGINLTVNSGDFYALLGANGAGKTTAIGILTTLVNRTSGDVTIGGYDLFNQAAQAKALLGMVPQEFNLNIFEPCWQIMINQAAFYGWSHVQAAKRATSLLKQLDLWEKRNTPAGKLSGGMKRRLMIARALVHEPQILILDEPTAGVDVEIRQSMWHFLQDLNRKGLTIVLTTHYLEEAESLCNRVAIIDKGQILVETQMRELLSQLESEKLLFDLGEPLSESPQLGQINCRLREPKLLEVEIKRGQALNEVFAALNQLEVPVLSMRNTANRLEQLFMHLVYDHKEEASS